jgi:uncharacterized cupin superfamily protein
MSHRAGGIAHWDDVAPWPIERADMRGTCLRIGPKAGALAVGLSRYLLPPGGRSMPVHAHADEEEIFHVLAGTGLVWIDGATHPVGTGDTIVHPAGGPAHTILAGAEQLDVLSFGSGSATGLTYLPRPQVFWAGPHWLPAYSPHPFDAEAACGPLELPEPSAERPATILALADAPVDPTDRDGYRGVWRDLGNTAGSRDSGLCHVVLEPGQMSCPPHWHGAEEELFVVLDGAGDLVLLTNDLVETRTPVVAGNVIARPPGTGVAHALVAGDAGLTYLAYGTRRPDEIAYYPRSRKAWLGPLMVRVEPVADYWDGEP